MSAVVIVLLAAALPGCKIVKTPTAEEKAAEIAKTAFDPAARVNEIWQSQAVPYLEKRAGALSDITAATKANADDAGAKFGNPKKQSNSPWTFVVRLEGKVVAAETASRAATLDIDVDGDGKADAKVQIGPAIRGTALRDSLDFVDFNAFKNQIEWAQFGKAFNQFANDKVLAAVQRDGLTGRTVKVVGAYPLPSGADLPLVTPATISVEP